MLHHHGVHVAGIAFVVYALIGFFGAADFGSNTQGNILENDLGGGAGQGVLNIAMSCTCDATATCLVLASWHLTCCCGNAVLP